MIDPVQNIDIRMTYRDVATNSFLKHSDRRVLALKKEAAAAAKNYQKMVTATSKATKGTKQLTTSMDRMRIATHGLQRQIGIIRNALLVFFFVLRPIQRALSAITDAARQQELAETKLALAIKGSGMATKVQIAGLEEYAASLQQTTIYGDEQIINAMAMLATFKMNSEQIKAVTPRVLDMARGIQKLTGSQVDLQDIAKAVAKGLNGDIGSLTRYGVVLSDSVKKSKDFNKILEEIDKNYKDMSKAQMNYIDQSAQMSNAWSDLKQAMGEIITKSSSIGLAIVMLKERFIAWHDVIKTSKRTTEAFSLIWTKSILAITTAAMIGKGAIDMLGSSLDMIAATAVLAKTKKDLDDYMKIFEKEKATKSISNTIITMLRSVDKTEKPKVFDVEPQEKRILEDRVRLAEEALRKTRDPLAAFDKMKGKIHKFYDTWEERLKSFNLIWDKLFTEDMPAAIKSSEDKLLEWGIKWQDIAQRTATGMHSTFSNLFFDMMKRDMDDLRDYMAEFGNVLLKILSEVIAKMMIVKMFPKMGSYLGVVGAVVPSPGSASGSVMAPGSMPAWNDPSQYSLGHRGGILSQGKIKEYHNGGEVHAKLLTGEGILSRTGMMNLGAENLSKINQGQQVGGGGDGGSPIIVIQAWDTQDVMRNIKTITNAIAQNMQNNGTMRKAVQNFG